MAPTTPNDGWLPIVGGPMNDCEFYWPLPRYAGQRVRCIPADLKKHCTPGYYCVGLNRDRIEWNPLATAGRRA